VQFYLELKEYKMLFDSKDFCDRAKRIWQRYLDDKADRMVNLPSAVHKGLKKEIIDKDCADVGVKTFDKANKENLQLITDNVYPAWLKKFKPAAAAAEDASAPAPAPAAASGGCCVIS
jgi:hypothetical protein